MSWWQAIVLGVVQGLTEWLPISSTAHLRVVPALLGWNDPGAAFTAVIQWGTLVAALVYFWRDIVRIGTGFFRGILAGKPVESPEARLGWMIVVGTIPIVVLGLLLKGFITGPLRSLYVIAGALIGLALVLVVAELVTNRRRQEGVPELTMTELGWGRAMLIGLCQAVALIPGASRSGVTITGGLFVGLARAEAARFSFLLSLPSVFAAGVYELIDERDELMKSQGDALALIVATVVSGLVGYASIWFLMTYLKTRSTYLFVVYRLVLGSLLLFLLGSRILAPGP